MLKAAQDAVLFGDGYTPETLRSDRMRALAVIRCLEIIGDVAATVKPNSKVTYPKIPWRLLVHMRSRLTHLYFSTDLAVVLETCQHELPDIISELTAMIAAEETEVGTEKSAAA
jgi:uncharacterized protein with HEPN domain